MIFLIIVIIIIAVFLIYFAVKNNAKVVVKYGNVNDKDFVDFVKENVKDEEFTTFIEMSLTDSDEINNNSEKSDN